MHSLHVVYVGLMGNIHYLEILDWLAGWAGYDIMKDDALTAYRLKEQGKLPPAEPEDDDGLIEASAPKPAEEPTTAVAAERPKEPASQPLKSSSRPPAATGTARWAPQEAVRVSTSEPYPATVVSSASKAPKEPPRETVDEAPRTPLKEPAPKPAPKRPAAPPEKKKGKYELKDLVP